MDYHTMSWHSKDIWWDFLLAVVVVVLNKRIRLILSLLLCFTHTYIRKHKELPPPPPTKLWNANSSWDILIRHIFDIIEIDVNTSFFKISKPKHEINGWMFFCRLQSIVKWIQRISYFVSLRFSCRRTFCTENWHHGSPLKFYFNYNFLLVLIVKILLFPLV